MSFEVISTTYPPAPEIQFIQPQYSAQHLGTPISIGEKPNLSVNLIQSQINPVYQLELNTVIWSEENLFFPGINTKLEEINRKSGEIDSVSTKIRIGNLKSELEFNSQDIQNEMTLLSEGGFSFKIRKELQIEELKPKIQPVLSFKKSFQWFQDRSETKSKKKQVPLQETMRFGVPKRIKLNSPYLKSVKIDRPAKINQGNEINDFSKDIEDLTESLRSIINSDFDPKNTTFSLEGDLEDISAKLEFPVPGFLKDQLEFKYKTNLPEVMVEGKNLRDKMKSTISLKYGIDINDATKFEIQSSYNLRTTEHKIVFMTLIE